MKYYWELSENDWTNYCAMVENDMAVDYVGSCWVGDLCFDIVLRDDALNYDLYVGGVDSGYGYSRESDYPYDEAGGGSFDDSCIWMRCDEFKRVAERRFDEFITECADYIKTKANEPLHIW